MTHHEDPKALPEVPATLYPNQDGTRKPLTLEEAIAQAGGCAAPEPLAGVKHDGEKTNLALLPFEALEEVGKVLTFGAKKYAAHNWRGGFKWSRLGGAALRHTFAWLRGESKDPESGLSHLAHAACCLLFLISFEVTKAGEDDRYVVNV